MWIQEDTSLDHDPVDIRDHRTNIAQAKVHIRTMVNIPAHLKVKFEVVSLVDSIVSTIFRDLDIPVRQAKLTDRRIKGESIDTMACSIYQDGGCTIQHIAGCYESSTWLQKIFNGCWPCQIRYSPVDAEYGPYGNIDIDIAGAIEWIKAHHILSFLLGNRR